MSQYQKQYQTYAFYTNKRHVKNLLYKIEAKQETRAGLGNFDINLCSF